MSNPRLSILIPLMCICAFCNAQLDSTLESLQKIPAKYLSNIDNKIDKYSNRITSKTEKTLSKLSRWENKIKSILDQVSPETAQKLFGNNQLTFNGALQKLKEGKSVVEGYRTKYNEYRDKLTTSIKYLDDQKDKLDKKLIQPVNNAKKKLAKLEEDVSNTEAMEQFIKERKKQLINEAAKYLGKSKYLTKIDKEAYYYVETLRNYKELFSDKKKAEELALKLLNKIPAFKKFSHDNSMLASLFLRGTTGAAGTANLTGLQTRTNVNTLIQSRLASGGPNASQGFSQNMQQAKEELNKIKDKVMKVGGGSNDLNTPNFKPNTQKTKTFLQRLDFGANFQFTKPNSLLPVTANIALNVGYKLNDKSIIGIGAAYKMGLGSIQRISISHQGISLRSFIDWQLKKQFYISGGYEMNHNTQFRNITQLKNYSEWQSSGLIGISKKVSFKTKFIKGTNLQLMFDFLARQHIPTTQQWIFRTGYKF